MLWDHFKRSPMGYMIQMERVPRTCSNVAIIWFVLMNTYHHFFGSLIGPTVSSSFSYGCHSFLPIIPITIIIILFAMYLELGIYH
jgi:hypothetical protein